MQEPKLKITQKKYGGETAIVSMRLSRDLLREIERVAGLTGRNRLCRLNK